MPHSLSDLQAFMKDARTGLKTPVKEGDYNGLVEVMGHLMKVKERQVATDNMFEPLKQTIELLRTYGEEMPEEIHVKLQVDGRRGLGARAGRAARSPGRGRRGGCGQDPPLVDTEAAKGAEPQAQGRVGGWVAWLRDAC